MLSLIRRAIGAAETWQKHGPPPVRRTETAGYGQRVVLYYGEMDPAALALLRFQAGGIPIPREPSRSGRLAELAGRAHHVYRKLRDLVSVR